MTDEDLAKALTSQALPEESGIMSAIREVVDGIEIEAPRWEYWRQVGAAKLWQAILLSCNRDPEWRTPNECYTQSQGAIWGGLASLTNGQAAERLAIAVSRVGVDLPIFLPNQDKVARSTIELKKFVAWAMNLGWDIPDELKGMASPDSKISGSKGKDDLGEKERTTLLKIIIGMAISGYRYDPAAQRNDAVSEISQDLAKLGIAVTDDTVRSKLQDAKAFLPAKARQG